MDRGLTRKDFLVAGAGAAAGLSLLGGMRGRVLLGADEARAANPGLEIFQSGWPRAFYFRQTEDDAEIGQHSSYEEWEKRYLALNGIMGKALNEVHYYEVHNNLAFFRRYKERNPEKAVFLHYDGRGRRATDEATTRFFAGHFLHYEGTRLGRPVGASATEAVLRVADASVFSMGRYAGAVPDDIAIARVGGDGRPDWNRVEHVRLKAINPRARAITVERGAYGTRMLPFPAGSYLAAHVMFGPYYDDDHPENAVPLWGYNFSTAGPRDASGRNGGDALADYLGEKLGAGGELSFFDGIAFDVLEFVAPGRPQEEIDANGDGRADGGIVGGVNVYGVGTLRFTHELRKRLPGKIITADGTFPEGQQRSFGHLSGVESEGFPDLFDVGLSRLSKGANVLGFWGKNGASPSFNYVNFKYKQRNPERGRNTFSEPNLGEDESYKKLRLALASALFADAAFTNSGNEGPDLGWSPPPTPWRREDAMVQAFDELWRGVDQEPNWLGQPLGPPVFLASRAPDLLGGQGEAWPQPFVGRFAGEGASFSRAGGVAGEGAGMAIGSTKAYAAGVPVTERAMSFALRGVEVSREDLFVSLRLSASPLAGYPASVAHRVYVGATPEGAPASERRGSFTWANGRPFDAGFYYRGVGPGPVDLDFRVESDAPARFLRLTAHSAPEAVFREYENGAVFANHSDRPYAFDLGELFPGAAFRRIRGTREQDPVTNDGQPLGATLTLPPRDALLVARVAG